MARRLEQHIGILRDAGWDIEVRTAVFELPDFIRSRYRWIDDDLREFLTNVSVARTTDDKSWFVTASEFGAGREPAFSWNQWEVESLQAASGDEIWQQEIMAFWDNHFPVTLSVRDGYRYLAVRREDLAVVGGEEPEFEETEKVAASFDEMIVNFATSAVRRYV